MPGNTQLTQIRTGPETYMLHHRNNDRERRKMKEMESGGKAAFVKFQACIVSGAFLWVLSVCSHC